jgi:hypothetical protein
MNFISKHLIEKIYEEIKRKQAVLKHEHFYYFDEPIIDSKRRIDRINRWNPYVKNEVLPISWYSLDGGSLMEAYMKLKNNDFYIYKSLDDGKSYKTRIKKK